MKGHTLTLCTYNMHKGYRYSKRLVLSGIREALRALNCDVLCLQEIRGKDNHIVGVFNDQLAFLAEGTWPHTAYGKNMIYQHTHHGNAVLSQLPMQDIQHVDLTCSKVSRRGLMLCELAQGVFVICLHFGLLAKERRYQVKKLLELVIDQIPEEKPLIIAGDFNDFSLSVDRTLTQQGFAEVSRLYGKKLFKTFPSAVPLFPLDRVYYKNLTCQAARICQGVPWNKLSDHCPLVAEFNLPSIN